MNDMRKLMEAVEQLNEYSSVANDEVEEHLKQAAKALAKDAVIQASGVWDEEGDAPEGSKFHTGAKTGAEYIRAAAPKFLTDEYKKEIMAEFEQHFDEFVEYFLGYVGESIEEEIVQVDTPEFDDADDSMEFFSEYQVSDWKAVSPEFFEDLANELEHHGLKLYVADTGGDDYAWRIDK